MDFSGCWDRLRAIRELEFEARSRSSTSSGWNGRGRGTVRVEEADSATLVFHEQGTWCPQGGPELTFRNVFRWTWDRDGSSIRLEHLRFGPRSPVTLFDLVPRSPWVLTSAEPHVCDLDRYSAVLELDAAALHLSWTIIGPQKDERIAYRYRRTAASSGIAAPLARQFGW